MLVLIGIFLVLVWVVAWVYGVKMFFIQPKQPEPEPIPYFIDDEITAIYDQIDVYNRMLQQYENDLEYTSNIKQRLKLEKKIVDLEYQCSRLENKVNKLLDKWEG